jgi:hypothetical protein
MRPDDFKRHIIGMKLTFSYKPVLVKVMLDNVDSAGQLSKDELTHAFRQFYIERSQVGLKSEKSRDRNPSPLLDPEETTNDQIWQILVRYPLPLLDEFIKSDNELVGFNAELWSRMSAADLAELRALVAARIEAYYED